MKYNCIICGHDIEVPDIFRICARGNGKSILTLNDYIKRLFCSKKCFDIYANDIFEMECKTNENN